MPLCGIAVNLQNEGYLNSWVAIGAAPTYNPLGNMTTFLCKQDIVSAMTKFLAKTS
jgi:hypothetical protein